MSSTSTSEIVEALRASLKDVERLKRQNSRLLDERHEPIAIVGVGCRYPGGVRSREDLWELVLSGSDAISALPSDRGWDTERLYNPDPNHPGTSYVREGGFVHDAPQFDAAFFGIGPREALAMDPQQRLLLETCWEALEDARVDPLSLSGSRAGVFAGITGQDYLRFGHDMPSNLEGHGMTGGSGSVVSGRVAYTLGLEGPAVTVDTACSSSLVALHLACQALRSEECSLALAGGVTILATPTVFMLSSRQRVLSPDGRCKPFANAADGTIWGEGAGVVALERLSDAQRNGHRVLAVVRGSAVNQDGASNGLTAPNGPSQQRVIRQALASALLSASQIDAVEAHGTGTTLGDPIEAQAIIATYGQGRDARLPLWLGSIKSNIGHTQAGAGIAGVIKMAMAMRHGILPKTLHVDEPTHEVDWSAGTVSLLTESVPWPDGEEPRRAAVSSFGVSGTNAHVILEQAPAESPALPGARSPSDAPLEQAPSEAAEPASQAAGHSSASAELTSGLAQAGVLPWILSGKGELGLRSQAARLLERVERDSSVQPLDLGFSLLRRPAFEDRAAIVGDDRESLIEGLRALSAGESAANVVRGAGQDTGGVVFVFPGQGSQWPGMAVDLLDQSAVFARRMHECDEALGAFVDWSVESVLRSEPGAPGLEPIDVVQPVLFAVMVSLAELWRACGVRPDAVVGHSQGEIAAACVAGALSLEDGARVVALRSRALLSLSGKGGTVSVASPLRDVASMLERLGGGLSIAAVNGPATVVVSGEHEALSELLAICEADGVRTREMPIDVAAHSAQAEAIREEVVNACSSISPRSAEVPFYSVISGGLLDTAELDAHYWYRNLRETVQFERIIRGLAQEGYRKFVEISPHPVLTIGVQETFDQSFVGTGSSPAGHASMGSEEEASIIGSLRRDQGGAHRFLLSLAELWASGGEVDWEAVFDGSGAAEVSLPTYAFQRERYWIDAGPGSGDAAAIGLAPAEHPLLGAAVSLVEDGGSLFTGRLSLEAHPWLADHAVTGVVLLPGTALLEMALHGGGQLGCDTVQELVLQAPLILREGETLQLQMMVGEADQSGVRSVSIHTRPQPGSEDSMQSAGTWTRHASGTLAHEQEQSSAPSERARELARDWPPTGAETVAVEDLYDRMAEIGLEYGPAFQGLQAAWRRGNELFAEVSVGEQEVSGADAFAIHPALLDSALHAIGALSEEDNRIADGVRLPFSLSGVRLHANGAGTLRVALAEPKAESISLLALDESGAPVISIESLLSRAISPGQLRSDSGESNESVLTVEWSALAPSGEPLPTSGWATLEGDGGEGAPASEASLEGDSGEGVPASSQWAGGEPAAYPDLATLAAALEEGQSAPPVVLADLSGSISEEDRVAVERSASEQSQSVAGLAHHHSHRALALVQEWLAEDRFAGSRLVLITRGAVAAEAGEDLHGLAFAPVWGLLRVAQSESPDRLGLVDVDESEDSWSALPAAAAMTAAHEEPQLAIRRGVVLAPRLARGTPGALSAPAGEPVWRLGMSEGRTLDDLRLLAAPELAEPLAPGQVRVAMRVAGVNFRDVVSALGMVSLRHAGDTIGNEGAGVVLEVGEGVEDLAPGDRVMGLFIGAFGPIAVTDRQMIVRVPQGWTFAQAAAIPVTFLTAYYGLVDLAQLKTGERVLVHAAAGGVGMAAVQLARHLGAEVLGLASPPKWAALESLGCSEEQIASSRDLQFKERFLRATAGAGVDVVLSSLAGSFIDASLELMPRGGRFLEMGKTDIRDPADVATSFEDVAYRAFDLIEIEPERVQQILTEILRLFDLGELSHPPIRAWDIRRAPEAFRFMAQARHVGKIVLSLPAPTIAPHGTALITGGATGLGTLFARHLVVEHGVRGIVLASRRGAETPGAPELEAELRKLGAEVTLAACDVSDREQLRELLESIPQHRPLRAVVHAAGALDDGVIESLTAERMDLVMAPKVDAAWHLHELTKDLDLDAFILFSSAAGVLGAPGQGNYAAANTFMDALVAQRRTEGLPATSMAWGLWQDTTGLTAHLEESDVSRIRRAGMLPISSHEGLAMFDAARSAVEALTVPVCLDTATLNAQARTEMLPALLRGIVRRSARGGQRQGGGSLARRLREAGAEEHERMALEIVRAETAAVLGHASPGAVEVRRAFKDLGFDSLLAVELRNRLNVVTGMRLPATLVFDYPTPAVLARHLLDELDGVRVETSVAVAKTTSSDEPIAIVGMACRYAGAVNSPQELWDLVASGTDAISEFPRDRQWDIERLYDPESQRPGTTYAREGGFLYDAADFDAQFFGISPREAIAMDPQQRLLLEVSWESFEKAGIPAGELRGSDAGVFTGVTSQDYGALAQRSPDRAAGFLLVGLSASVLSGRLSYSFGFEGPAITVDTGCSSSLVALHLACTALRNGECSLALAGGVTVMSTPVAFQEFALQRGLARDGRCKSFADAADGTGWGEGAGILLLERLSDAQRKGHEVLAVVSSSAVNQDGTSNGLTAPNGPSQQRVIRQALANAGLSPSQVDVVEAHGTGTTLGDPIEAQALLAAYGEDRPQSRPLWLGSVKSNIGHTQGAAGVAGVIKMVMALQNETLPKTLHAEQPTTEVDWSAGEVSLLTEAQPWLRNGEARRAGVSSFGVSGTNVHVILEEAPAGIPEPHTTPVAGALGGDTVPWVISASSAAGLRGQAGRMRALLQSDERLSLRAAGLSLATTRSQLEHRALVLGRDRDELSAGLGALLAKESAANVVQGRDGGAGGIAFVFPGQGSQWVGMGVELLGRSEAFAGCLRDCGDALAPFVDWSLEDVLRGEPDAPGLDRVDVVQPVLFAVMVALARLWRICGVVPDVVVGHSQGEIAAACVAGGLSLEDGARVVASRAQALAELSDRGGMVSLACSEAELASHLERCGAVVSLAAINGPGSLVVSGESTELQRLLAWCEREQLRARQIPVDYAAHSDQVEQIRERLLTECATISPHAGEIPFCSAVTGGLLDTADLDADYWYRNLREPVLFERAVRSLLEQGHRTFIEASPHPVLTVGVLETVEDWRDSHEPADAPGTQEAPQARSLSAVEVAAIGSLRREDGGPSRFLHSLGEAWARGVSVDWGTAIGGSASARVELPTYAFQRERYWLDIPADAHRLDGQLPQPEDAEEARFWGEVDSENADGLMGTLRLDDEQERSSLQRLLPALADWRRRRRAESLVDDWRYRIDWKRLSDPPSALSGLWPVLLPAGIARESWPTAVIEALERHGARVLPIEIERELDRNALAQRISEALLVHPSRPDAEQSSPSAGNAPDAVDAGADRGTASSQQQRPAVAGVLSLLALDEETHTDRTALPHGLAATVTSIQALADAGVEGRLWLLTRDAAVADIADRLGSPRQAMIWGLGRTLSLEQPRRWGGLVDLPAELDERLLQRLCGVLAMGGEEDQIAVRASGVLTRRLERAPAGEQDAGRRWRPRGTVLLTGATGGLGPHVARWLAHNGAEHLLLVSRQGSHAPGAAELAAELELLGPRVSLAECDVAHREQLGELIAAIPPEHPLDAVVHVAGAGEMVMLDALTLDQAQHSLAAKAQGAWNLHELTQELELSAFVIFSSMAATMGSGAQGDYAAANEFVNALAEHRRARGLTATSVAWGAWSGAGMASLVGDLMHRRGLLDMAPELAIQALAQAINHEHACLTVTNIDWEIYAPTYASARARPLIEDLPEAHAALEGTHVQPQASTGEDELLASRLAGLSRRERERLVLDLVRSQAAGVLGHSQLDAVAPDRAFRDLGFDSLMAVELRKRLQAATGLRLAVTIIFDYPSSLLLTEHLLRQATGGPSAGAVARPAVAQTQEPIAIVAMSCRYPGGVRSSDSLWELVSSGTDAIGPFPTDRGWNLEALRDPNPERRGASHAGGGGFIHDVAEFDAPFFGISPREALAMDPQQRIFLEICWEVFERAGIDPLSLRGGNTGIFAGINPSPYGFELPDELEGYRVTSNAGAVVSGRVAYTLGLEGPAVSVDTACSSSLVALHLACSALRSGECDKALAGGVAVISSPVGFVAFSRQRGLAGDGRCKSFADAADGTGWSEGAGVLLLERLSDAQSSGHPILALVRGSAVNQDGASNGLTAPNGLSQQRVIRQALANAGLSADQVQAVEGHGTGTILGDPIEAQALLATYGQARRNGEPLWLGSVKSNIGHPQAASGVAGVIKMVMAMRHRTLPRTLHVDEPSTQVDWSEGAVSLLREERAWDSPEQPRRAGVSSFGASGTNAHAILEQPPMPSPDAVSGWRVDEREGSSREGLPEPGAIPWLISAKDAPALLQQSERLLEQIERDPSLEPVDVGFSLAVTRPSLDRRAVAIGDGRDALLGSLRSLARGEPDPALTLGGGGGGADTGVAFLFTGQGSQRVGMGRELYNRFAVFKRALDEACGHLNELLKRSLLGVMFGVGETPEPAEESLLGETMFTQTGLFALEIALFKLLEDFGLDPDYLLGHSVGELAAAHVAGVLDLAQACELVAARGRLMGALPGGGAMVAIEASEQEARESFAGLELQVSLAAVNGPTAVVISGEQDAVLELERLWDARKRKTKRLRVSHAFHSPRMDDMLDAYAQVAAGLSFSAPRIPIVSNLTGEPLAAEQACDPAYWVAQARQPVSFRQGVGYLASRGVSRFLELGPDGVLSAMVRECLAQIAPVGEQTGEQQMSLTAVSTQRGARPQAHALLSSLAELWVEGVTVDWSKAFDSASPRRVQLPTYAFQRRRYWLDSPNPTGGGLGSSASSAGEHPILEGALALADGHGWLFTGRLSIHAQPWLGDHVVFGEVLVPGTTFVDLALRAAEEVGCDLLEELVMELPLLLSPTGEVQLQVSVSDQDEQGRRKIEIYSRSSEPGGLGTLQAGGSGASQAGGWTRHASGALASVEGGADQGRSAMGVSSLAGAWPPAGAEPLAVESLHAVIAQLGVQYGPSFLSLTALWRRGEELFAELRLPEQEWTRAGGFQIHPALLDAALQVSVAYGLESEQLQIPFAWGGVSALKVGARAIRAHVSPSAISGAISLTLAEETGAPLAAVDSLVSRVVTPDQLGQLAARRQTSLLRVNWSTVDLDRAPTRFSGALVGAGAARLMGAGAAPPMGSQPPQDGSFELYRDLHSLREALDRGAPTPQTVMLSCAPEQSSQAKASAEQSSQAKASAEQSNQAKASIEQDGAEEATVGDALAEQLRENTHAALDSIQQWLADDRLSASRLILITRNAVATKPADRVDGVAQAAIWGLARTAQTENPHRLLLVDLDDDQRSLEALASIAGAPTTEESQLAIRQGSVLAPRLTPIEHWEAPVADPDGKEPLARSPFDPSGTVLLTGGAGGLGRLVARHLVAQHEVRHLLLTSRPAGNTEGAAELARELEQMGARVSIVTCDVSEREQLEALLGAISPEHPLGAVVHLAGVIDDGAIGALTAERVDRALSAKATAAWHLHSLTEHLDLSAFVLFSSASGVLGGMGQANYAAANTFLDALAARRRALGMAGVSLAWGPWDASDGMTEHLTDVDGARMTRAGLLPLSESQALDLLDHAHRSDESLLVPVRLDKSVLAVHAREAASRQPMLRGLLGRPLARSERVEHGALARRLAGAPAHEHERILLEAVRSHAAAALGYAASEELETSQSFKELGFDSLAAIELRNRLNEATGVSLPATLIFDYPTPRALVGHLLECVVPDGTPATVTYDGELDRLERLLATAASEGADRSKIRARLQAILDGLTENGHAEKGSTVAEEMQAATAEQIFDFIDKELRSK